MLCATEANSLKKLLMALREARTTKCYAQQRLSCKGHRRRFREIFICSPKLYPFNRFPQLYRFPQLFNRSPQLYLFNRFPQLYLFNRFPLAYLAIVLAARGDSITGSGKGRQSLHQLKGRQPINGRGGLTGS